MMYHHAKRHYPKPLMTVRGVSINVICQSNGREASCHCMYLMMTSVCLQSHHVSTETSLTRSSIIPSSPCRYKSMRSSTSLPSLFASEERPLSVSESVWAEEAKSDLLFDPV
jgi:hypothetical protein